MRVKKKHQKLLIRVILLVSCRSKKQLFIKNTPFILYLHKSINPIRYFYLNQNKKI
jgi:hypothetical protein